MINKKFASRIRRKKGIRKNINGTSDKPRVTIFRSSKNIYAQAIDDENGVTLLSLSTLSPEVKQEIKFGGNVNAAEATGKIFNEKLKEKGIKKIVFDRNGYLFHGRVKAFSDKIELKNIKKGKPGKDNQELQP
ncbi:MAG: 50S ribosomal protein L18 [Atribacterota bacterium]|nr:50S ribosomal protein L18 [Atribacterota bacterium]